MPASRPSAEAGPPACENEHRCGLRCTGDLKAGQRLSDPRGTIAFWNHGSSQLGPWELPAEAHSASVVHLHGVPPQYSDVVAEELATLDVNDEGFCFDEIRRLVGAALSTARPTAQR